MGARRSTAWVAGLLPALLCIQVAVVSGASAPSVTTATTATAALSAPLPESIPLPVHDEATCAFCQAAAFAPHTSSPVDHFAVAAGDEHRIHLSQDDHLTSTASAGPARSRAPPVIRSV